MKVTVNSRSLSLMIRYGAQNHLYVLVGIPTPHCQSIRYCLDNLENHNTRR